MEKYKIIIDTDIGDDIDDAFALAVALALPEYEILGITSVYRNVNMRSKIAKAELDYYGHGDIKVYCGEDYPIKEPLKMFPFERKGEDGKVIITHYQENMAGYNYEEKSAIDFLLESAKKHPNEIVLFAIGPLTNLARAYQQDSETFKKFKKIVIMGGIINQSFAEWNIKCDPEAADIVLKSGVDIQMVGLDITRKCVLKDETLKQILSFESKGNKLLASMMKIWIKNNNKNPILHDPLTIASFVRPFCEFSKHKVEVILDGDKRGYTVESQNGNEILYAENVDNNAFEQFILDTLKKAESNCC
ncbi:MAG TPA: nucleoside hydrolase [Clostridia bacterium]